MSITFIKYKWDHIDCIEDPILSNFYMDKHNFFSIYQPLLETFDGRDLTSYIDFFLKNSVTNNRLLVFSDDDTKEDFRSLADEMNLIPSFIEICEGESPEEKLRRSLSSDFLLAKPKEEDNNDKRQKQKEKQKDKLKISNEDKEHLKLKQTQDTLNILLEKLNNETNEDNRRKITEKISRIKQKVEISTI